MQRIFIHWGVLLSVTCDCVQASGGWFSVVAVIIATIVYTGLKIYYSVWQQQWLDAVSIIEKITNS